MADSPEKAQKAIRRQLTRVPNPCQSNAGELRNASSDDRLIVPMHIGFFQPGAQNHTTSRVLVLEAGETIRVTDCLCIQAVSFPKTSSEGNRAGR